MGLDELIECEAGIDRRVRELPYLRLPRLAVLAGLIEFTYAAEFGGGRLTHKQAYDASFRGEVIANRLSYLLNLIQAAPLSDVELPVARELYRTADPVPHQRLLLAQYGHLSELMPEVRRGNYSVSGDRTTLFRLDHRSPAFAQAEAIDTILSGLGAPIAEPPRADLAIVDAVMREGIGSPNALTLMYEFAEHYRNRVRDVAPVDDGGMQAACGLTLDEFGRIRAALLAFGELHLLLARRANAAIGRGLTFEYATLFADSFYVGVAHDAFVAGIAALAGCAVEAVERMLPFITLDMSAGPEEARRFGDGLMPPLARRGGRLYVAPQLLRLFVTVRNVLFVVNRIDRRLFDEVLSSRLEPRLLDQADELFTMTGRVVVARNVTWRAGEIDLLVYRAEENRALHIQGKAPLAPQGARMTKALADHSRRGLDQLAALRSVDAQIRDEVLSRALGIRVSGAAVVDVLLTSSSFGDVEVWERARREGVILVNLPLLRGVLHSGRAFHVDSFASRVRALTNRIVRDLNPRWVHRPVAIEDVTIEMPFLDLEREKVLAWQAHLHGL